MLEDYGLNPQHTPLADDIEKTWGHNLKTMSAGDGLYIIESAARFLRMKNQFDVTEAGEEVVLRLPELADFQIDGLIEAIQNSWNE